MFGAKTINRHAALMNRMAETLGVDLTEAIADGRLPAEAWREAVSKPEARARAVTPDVRDSRASARIVNSRAATDSGFDRLSDRAAVKAS